MMKSIKVRTYVMLTILLGVITFGVYKFFFLKSVWGLPRVYSVCIWGALLAASVLLVSFTVNRRRKALLPLLIALAVPIMVYSLVMNLTYEEPANASSKLSLKETQDFLDRLSEKLDPDRWKEFSLDERKKFLETVTAIEAPKLEIRDELSVEVEEISSEDNIHVSYDDETKAIVFDKGFVESEANPYFVLNHLFSGLYRGYEQGLVEDFNSSKDIDKILYYRDALKYKNKLGEYHDDKLGSTIFCSDSDCLWYSDLKCEEYYEYCSPEVKAKTDPLDVCNAIWVNMR